MGINSSLYECTVMHHRLEPLRHRFVYNIFMVYLDLDEIDTLHLSMKLFSRNRLNLFALYDRDHLNYNHKSIKENIREYLKSNGVDIGGGKIFLLTNLRTAGYVFNPVSFYFCFDENGDPICVVPEVGNTFNELKPYFLGRDSVSNGIFRKRIIKYFYVSPFFDLDTTFDFQLEVPGEKLNIHIDDYQDGKKAFLSSLVGTSRTLTDSNLFRSFLRIPFVTLKVIALIHIHAGLLLLKKLPYKKKSNNPELQKEVFTWNK
jgi:DUF1365 family protein